MSAIAAVQRCGRYPGPDRIGLRQGLILTRTNLAHHPTCRPVYGDAA